MNPPNPTTVSIIIAVYNQRNLLQHFHTILCETLWRLPYDFEIILVDDGSTDKSADLVAGMSKRDRRMRLLIVPQHLGREAAIAIGLRAAHGAVAVILDATASHRVNLIPYMLKLWENGARMVTIPSGFTRLRLVDRAVMETYNNRLEHANQEASPFDRMDIPTGLTLFPLPRGLRIVTRFSGGYFAGYVARLNPRIVCLLATAYSLIVLGVCITTDFISVVSGVILLISGWIICAVVLMIISMVKEWQDRPFVDLGNVLRHFASGVVEHRPPITAPGEATDGVLVGHSQPIRAPDNTVPQRTKRSLAFARHFPPAAYA